MAPLPDVSSLQDRRESLTQPDIEGERFRVFTDGRGITGLARHDKPAQHQVHIPQQYEPRREAGKRRDRRRFTAIDLRRADRE